MRCYLVRHAQTAWNGQNRLQGHSDIPLSAFGEQQAQRVGGAFATRRIGGLFTSSLQRSRQTAHAIARANGQGLAPQTEPSLAEIHLGAWEGLTPDEIDARFDGAYQRWRLCPSTVEIPGGEPLVAFRQRVRDTFERLIGTFQQEGEYVIVSHGGVIAALLAEVLEAEYDALLRRLCLDNAGITALECGFGPSAQATTVALAQPIRLHSPRAEHGTRCEAGLSPERSRRTQDSAPQQAENQGTAKILTGLHKPHVLWVNSTLHLEGLLVPSSQAAIAAPSITAR